MYIESILIMLVLSVIIGAITLVLYYQYFAFKYWEKRGIPCETPRIPAGNLGNIMVAKQHIGEIIADLYKVYKSKGYKHGGLYVFYAPVYLPLDLDIIKSILTRDFQYFTDRAISYDEVNEPLTANLITLDGERWTNLRHKLTPTFTSNKLKMMFQILIDCADEMIVACDQIATKNEVLDARDISTRYSIDVISSSAFGFECNNFKNSDTEFRKYGKKVFLLTLSQKIINFFGMVSPKITKLLPFRHMDEEASVFFMNAIKQIIDYREKNAIKRIDLLNLLMELQNPNGDDGKHTETGGTYLKINEIAAQAFSFFVAGFETSSTTITFCLCELARNSTIQDKLRQEVLTVLEEYDGQLTYDGIMKMPYMEQVVQETLRKYPIIPYINRKTVANYQIPNSNLILEKGTIVFISVLGLHHDPEYFPSPELFDPERFNKENKKNRPSSVFLPFGDGPRNCIGLRFAKMEIYICLAVLISRYIFSLNKETQYPLEFSPNTLHTLIPASNIWLDIKKIDTHNM